MAANLTTLYLAKLFAGVASVADDKLIERLIDQACELAGQMCHRTWAVTTYRQWLDGNGFDRMLLPQWPVTRLYRVATQRNDVLTVKYSGTGKHANLSADTSGLYLDWIDAAGAAQSGTVLWSASPTVGEVATAIAAISADWSATAESDYSTDPAAMIRPVQGCWVKSPDDCDLETPDDGVPVQIVSQTNRAIERTDGGTFPAGRGNIFVWFTAGYTLKADDVAHTKVETEGTVPAGLTLVINEIVRDVYRSHAHSDGMKSETIADYSYTRGDTERAVARHWQDLSPYANLET